MTIDARFPTRTSDDTRADSRAPASDRCAVYSCRYNNALRIPYDAVKRQRTLRDRGLDFEDAAALFQGITVEIDDLRKDYGERRVICYGFLGERLVVVGYTPRGAVRHIFSMRKTNQREQARLAPYLGL